MSSFRDAYNAVIAQLTPQPWDYTDDAGATLTVIPACMHAAPGDAEVTVRITASHTLAEAGVTTSHMPGLLAALDQGTGWEHVTLLDDQVTVTPQDGGGLVLTVTAVDYDNDRAEIVAAIRLPAAQRLPLASALRRATDVARGWEDDS